MKEDIAFRQSKRLGHTRAYVVFDWMANLAIDAAGGGSKVFGTKPGVADYTPTDLTEEAGRAARGNIKNLDAIMAMLEKVNPGFGEMLRTGSKNTLSLLRGEIPEDVQNAVKRSSAFRSLSGGFSGSPMSRALTARDFGNTSLDLMGRGENSAQKWMSMAQGSVKPFIVTAPDQAEATFKNRLYDQATSQFKFNVLGAADPAAAGLFNTIATIGGTAASFGLSAMGGAMGGGAPTAPAGGSGTTAGGAAQAGASSLGNWWTSYGGG